LKLKSFIKSNYFLLVILAVLIFSIMFPTLGLKTKEAGVLDILTFIAMFSSSLGLSFKNLTSGLKDYKSILYSFVAVFFIFPLVTWILMYITSFRQGDVFTGFMILSAQSSTVSSGVVLTMAASGNVPLALIITIVNNILSAFVTPTVLKFILTTDQQIVFNIGEMISNLVVVLVVPVLLAQVIRLFVEKWLKYINPVRKVIGQIVVVFFVLTGGASAAGQLTSNIKLVFIVVLLVAVLNIAMMAIGKAYSRIVKVGKESEIAIMFNSSQKTLPATILIWGNYFSQYSFAPIVFVAYHMTQLIIGSVVGSKYKTLIEAEKKK